MRSACSSASDLQPVSHFLLMHLLSIQRLLGLLLMIFSATLLPPVIVSLLYQDGEVQAFLAGMVAVIVLGFVMWLACASLQAGAASA